jgi:hypothetical protein
MSADPYRGVIECLVGAHPHAVQEPDKEGRIPLHHAVANSLLD